MTALFIYQGVPIVAYLLVAWQSHHAFMRAWRRKPRPFDMVEVPIFFAALGIAYNIGWAMFAGSLHDPENIYEAVGRILGITFHIACAVKLIHGLRAIRGHIEK